MKLEPTFQVSQGSAATDFRWGENFNKFLFRNSLLNIVLKKLRKSVNICQSYRKNNSGTFFYGPRCILVRKCVYWWSCRLGWWVRHWCIRWGWMCCKWKGQFWDLKSSFGVSSPHWFQWNSDYGRRQVLLNDLFSFSQMIGVCTMYAFCLRARYIRGLRAWPVASP